MDSGVDANFMDKTLANKLKLTAIPLDAPLSAIALDGRLLCLVTHRPFPVILSFLDTHSEEITFRLYNATQHPLILKYY